MKKKNLRILLIILFFLVSDFSINIFAMDHNVNPFLRAISKGVLTAFCMWIYFKWTPKKYK